MTAPKFTKGPWRIGDAGTAVFGPKNGNYLPVTIAQRVRKDDIHLVTAAPDLYAALEAVLPYVPGYVHGDTEGRPHLTAAIAALAKARGEV